MTTKKDTQRRSEAVLASVTKEMAKPRLSASAERTIAKKR
jgi:hypothetical protein